MYLGQGFKPPKDGVTGLFCVKKAANKNDNKLVYSPLPTASEMTSEVVIGSNKGLKIYQIMNNF
jgi:hypothetical protein